MSVFEVRYTKAYACSKNNFLSANNENSLLVSSIKRVERRLADETFPDKHSGLTLLFLFELTNLPLVSTKYLCCVAVVNFSSQALAPCHMFLVGEQAVNPDKTTALAGYAKAVIEELQW